MDIRIGSKVTMASVALIQGENNFTTINFDMPGNYGNVNMHSLSWQLRVTNKCSGSFAFADLIPGEITDERFPLPWAVADEFTSKEGDLDINLSGSDGDTGNILARFVVEGIYVKPIREGDSPPPPYTFQYLVDIAAGKNIVIDKTDPKRPVISATSEGDMMADDYDPTGEVGLVGIPEYVSSKLPDDSGWLPMTPLSGTTELRALGYRKIGNVVYLKGAFGNVASSGNAIAILPVGFRPSGVLRTFVVPTNYNAATTSPLQINTVGSLIVSLAGGSTLDIGGISFAI